MISKWIKQDRGSPSQGSAPPVEGGLSTEELIRNFGDLVYDLFFSVLWSARGAQTLYLQLWQSVERRLSKSNTSYRKHARAWTLQLAVELLKKSHSRLGRTLSPSEQVMLDANLNIPARLKQFESYVHKLQIQDQILLLLREKYGLPYSEIAAALRIPEGSLRVKHQQALKSLEEWLWDRT